MPTKSRRKQGGSTKGLKFRRQRTQVAKNLLKGMTAQEAMVKAGYTPATADKCAFAVVRHPQVQSILTESLARVLAEEQKQFDDIVRPYVKALDANVVVKMPAIGDAVQTKVVDHAIRMAAAEHLTNLYRSKVAEAGESGEGAEDKPTVVYQINFINGSSKEAPTVVNPSVSSPSDPQVAFVRGKR